MFRRLRNWFRNSGRVHIREAGPENYRDLVALFDRFIDGPMRYPLEWDDFISWTNGNPNIEAIRNRISEFEPLLFSPPSSTERARYVELLVAIRNECAAIVGIPPRLKNSN